MSDDHDRIDPELGPEPHPDPSEEALTRALRAPGTPAELAAREDYLAMFRVERHHETLTPVRRPHLVRRFGAGSALAAVLALGGGGVAAAYAGTLPEPLQRAAHRVLGPIGAPPAAPDRPIRAKATPSPRATPQPATPTPTSTPTSGPSTPPSSPGGRGGAQPSKKPKPSTSPSASPSQTPTTDPSSSPTPSEATDPTASPTVVAPTPAPVLQPAKVNIRPTAKRVQAGATTTFFGTVTDSRKRPVPLATVFLQQRGRGGWVGVGSATSDEDGDITLVSPVLQETSSFRLSVGVVHSKPYGIQMVPVLTTTTNPSGQLSVVTVSARGGSEGDAVTVTFRAKGRTTVVGRGRLDFGGTVSLSLEQRGVATSYVVLLSKTKQHTEARTTFDLPASGGGG